MNFEFNTIAYTRARYYTKGSPVQFVLVELLRAKQTNEIAVTLTFKNISGKTLNSLKIKVVCKDENNNIVAQTEFAYSDLNVHKGALFGMDDAVIMSNEAISNVEVMLVSANFEGKEYSLEKYRRVALPPLNALSEGTVAIVNNALNNKCAKYMPCNVQDGWQCTCGAFNYNIGEGKIACLECFTNKKQLINILRAAQKNSAPKSEGNVQNANNGQSEQKFASEAEGQNMGALQNYAASQSLESAQNEGALQGEPRAQSEGFFPSETSFQSAENNQSAQNLQSAQNHQNEESVFMSKPQLMTNETADKIIRRAPIVTGATIVLYFICLIIIDLFFL